MSPINFLFAIHNHQPVGNFDSVFEKAFNECYLPQIEVLKRHPEVRMAIHHSGPLFEWIEVNKPEYFKITPEKTGRRSEREVRNNVRYTWDDVNVNNWQWPDNEKEITTWVNKHTKATKQ